MSIVPIKNKYKTPAGQQIPYQGYGYGSVFVPPPTVFGPQGPQGQAPMGPYYPGPYPGGTPPTFPPGTYGPPVDPRTLPTIPQRQRQPEVGTLQLPTPNPNQDRVITPGEAAQIPADTGPGRFNPDLINPGYPAPYDPGGWGGGTPPPPGTVGQVPPAPGAPRTGIRGFYDKLTSSPNAESLYTMGSILAGNPQPNESQLQQVVRAVGGAMSTRGAYAQMQQAKAEAARKADLEWRQHQIAAQDAATRQKEAEERVRTKDREIDVQEGTLAATTEANKLKAEEQKRVNTSLMDYRAQQIEELKNRANERTATRTQRDKQFEAQMKVATSKEQRESIKAQHEYDNMLDDNERAWEQLKINRINAMAQDKLARMAPIMKAAESMYSTVLMFDRYNVPVEKRGQIIGQIEQWMEDRQNGKNSPFPTFDLRGITQTDQPPPAGSTIKPGATTAPAPTTASPQAAAPPAGQSEWGKDEAGRWVRWQKRPDGSMGYMWRKEDAAGPPKK